MYKRITLNCFAENYFLKNFGKTFVGGMAEPTTAEAQARLAVSINFNRIYDEYASIEAVESEFTKELESWSYDFSTALMPPFAIKEEYGDASFGEKLRELRKQKGLTLQEFSAKMGLKSHNSITMWESGERLPKPDSIKKLAEVLEVDYIELLKLR